MAQTHCPYCSIGCFSVWSLRRGSSLVLIFSSSPHQGQSSCIDPVVITCTEAMLLWSSWALMSFSWDFRSICTTGPSQPPACKLHHQQWRKRDGDDRLGSPRGTRHPSASLQSLLELDGQRQVTCANEEEEEKDHGWGEWELGGRDPSPRSGVWTQAPGLSVASDEPQEGRMRDRFPSLPFERGSSENRGPRQLFSRAHFRWQQLSLVCWLTHIQMAGTTPEIRGTKMSPS